MEGKTWGPQKALPARACGFESHPGHHGRRLLSRTTPHEHAKPTSTRPVSNRRLGHGVAAILRSVMDVRADIDALVDAGPRAPGSDAERRAAAYLKQRLEGLGRQAEVESVDVWPAWPFAPATGL